MSSFFLRFPLATFTFTGIFPRSCTVCRAFFLTRNTIHWLLAVATAQTKGFYPSIWQVFFWWHPDAWRVTMVDNPKKQALQWLATALMMPMMPMMGSFPLHWLLLRGQGPLIRVISRFVFPSIMTLFGIFTLQACQIDGVFPFNDLPIELQNKIIGHAMTATGHQIVMPCLTNTAYMPNIAVGLLLAK